MKCFATSRLDMSNASTQSPSITAKHPGDWYTILKPRYSVLTPIGPSMSGSHPVENGIDGRQHASTTLKRASDGVAADG
jgi:hypothetical protein